MCAVGWDIRHVCARTAVAALHIAQDSSCTAASGRPWFSEHRAVLDGPHMGRPRHVGNANWGGINDATQIHLHCTGEPEEDCCVDLLSRVCTRLLHGTRIAWTGSQVHTGISVLGHCNRVFV
jgi:hypothetical protein